MDWNIFWWAAAGGFIGVTVVSLPLLLGVYFGNRRD